MKKIWILFIIVIIVGVWAYVYRKETAKAPAPEAMTQTSVSTNPAAATPTATPSAVNSSPPVSIHTAAGTASYSSGSEGGADGSSIQVYEVDFTNSGFSPTKLNLNVGDYIFFRNKSTINFLPADSLYSGFGPAAAVSPGKEYKFEFNNPGTWTVKNQLNPTQTTVVVVSK